LFSGDGLVDSSAITLLDWTENKDSVRVVYVVRQWL